MNFCVVAAAVALLVSHKAICADARIIGSENSNLNAQTLSLTVEALSASANINSNDANADAAVNATVNLFKLANQLSSLVSSNNTAAISTVLQEIQLLLQGADYNPSGALDILSAVSEALAEIESGSFDPASLAEIATAVAQVSSTDAIVWLAVLANQLSDLAPSNNTGEISKVLQEIKTLLLSVRNEPIGLPTILSTVSKAPAEIKSGLNDSDRLRKIASAVAQVSSTDAINRLHSLAKELIFQAAYNEKVVAVLRQTTTLLRSLLNSAPKKYGSAIADLATSVVAVEASFLRGDVTQASLTEVATKIAQFAANAALDNYTDILNALWMQSSALTSNGKNPEIKKILQEIREILSRIGLVAETLRDPIQAVISIVSAAPNNPSSTTFIALSDSLSDLIKTLQQLGDLSLF